MGSTSGTGFSTTQETAVVGSTSTSKLLYYRSDIETLGSTTVSWKRGVDLGAWSGDGKYFRIETSHIGIIDSSGETDASQYIANSVAIPIAPTSWSETSTGTTNIEMSWTDNSAIEDDFKVYRKEGSAADSGDDLAGTVPANNGAFDDTGLSNNSAPTISAFGGGTSDSVVISGNITNRIVFTASGIDDYELKFNTTGHSSAYSSTAISKTSSGISGGSINQLLLHSGVAATTTHYYQITAYKDGKTYYYAVYANNGGTLSTSAATGNATLNQVTSTSTTSLTSTDALPDRTLATNDSASALDTWANQTNTYKYSDAFVLTLANTRSNDKILITVTHSGDTLSDITTKIAVNKDNNNPPYNSNGATPDGTSVQESGNVGGATTLTFSSLSSGTNYFTCQIEGLSDGTVNASGIETATFTVTAVVKDSGDSTVVASATYHTYQQRMNPLA